MITAGQQGKGAKTFAKEKERRKKATHVCAYACHTPSFLWVLFLSSSLSSSCREAAKKQGAGAAIPKSPEAGD
jgi:hypothetical protein